MSCSNLSDGEIRRLALKRFPMLDKTNVSHRKLFSRDGGLTLSGSTEAAANALRSLCEGHPAALALAAASAVASRLIGSADPL
jgi:hypothetical protein